MTIAVDSYGPVTDNAQSVYELSQIEGRKGIKEDIKKNFGFKPDFENAKYQLEKGDGAGNTFKATAKPVLIGTAVVGATTMVFGIIMLLENMFGERGVSQALSIVQPEIILGLIMGGSVIYWFTGASCQAVVTGAYRAVVYIKENMKLDATTASEKDSKEVVRICTVYAQKGMWNIFIVIFCFALALPFFNPYFFIGYLIGIAFFGLFQAIFMANAGGAWDNAKKIVEVDLRQKGTDLHAATVVGDTVGDPFKDTSSVAHEPGDQVHHAVRPARGGNRRDHDEPEPEDRHRRVLLPRRADLRLSLLLRNAHPRREELVSQTHLNSHTPVRLAWRAFLFPPHQSTTGPADCSDRLRLATFPLKLPA